MTEGQEDKKERRKGEGRKEIRKKGREVDRKERS